MMSDPRPTDAVARLRSAFGSVVVGSLLTFPLYAVLFLIGLFLAFVSGSGFDSSFLTMLPALSILLPLWFCLDGYKQLKAEPLTSQRELLAANRLKVLLIIVVIGAIGSAILHSSYCGSASLGDRPYCLLLP